LLKITNPSLKAGVNESHMGKITTALTGCVKISNYGIYAVDCDDHPEFGF
jgi:hypothetical protein